MMPNFDTFPHFKMNTKLLNFMLNLLTLYNSGRGGGGGGGGGGGAILSPCSEYHENRVIC